MYDKRNKFKEKNSRIKSLNLNINNVIINKDSIRINNNSLIKQTKIYYNIAKRLDGKLTLLYHSSNTCKEQHIKHFPFITFKKELVDEIFFDYECRVSMFH